MMEISALVSLAVIEVRCSADYKSAALLSFETLKSATKGSTSELPGNDEITTPEVKSGTMKNNGSTCLNKRKRL